MIRSAERVNLVSNQIKSALNEAKETASIAKVAATDYADKVYDYLKGDYPKETIEWVKPLLWKKKKLQLSEIKMARRPGGARETDKTKAIKEKYEAGDKMDPVVVVKDGNGDYRLADGYHRTLGCKQAGFDEIEAYVAETTKTDGPWKSEMHEKKLSKGIKNFKPTTEKTASIDKEANPFGAVGGALKTFGRNLSGANKRSAKKNLRQAKEFKKVTNQNSNQAFKNLNQQTKNDTLGIKNQQKDAVKKFGGRKTIGARFAKEDANIALKGVKTDHGKAMNDIRQSNMYADNKLSTAKQDFKAAKKATSTTRAVTGLAGLGVAGAAYNANKGNEEEQNQQF